MSIGRSNQLRRTRSKDPLDRRLDQWIETSRQFVDGVAGNRPGKRRAFNFDRRSNSSLGMVGKWVGEKIDWLLEDEDDWLEPWQEQTEVTNLTNKKPLEAISRRTSKVNSSSFDNKIIEQQENWPDESSFKVDRWQRKESVEPLKDYDSLTIKRQRNNPNSRPLPRSSRRRN